MAEGFPSNISDADDIEIWIMFFPAIRQSLIIDTRSDELDGPWIALAPMVSSVEERIEQIKKERPRFPATEKVAFLPLPLDIAGLERSSLWTKIVGRFQARSDLQAIRECQKQLDTLLELEKHVKSLHTNRGAVLGVIGFETLWQRKK
jgi:hypothetical protein